MCSDGTEFFFFFWTEYNQREADISITQGIPTLLPVPWMWVNWESQVEHVHCNTTSCEISRLMTWTNYLQSFTDQKLPQLTLVGVGVYTHVCKQAEGGEEGESKVQQCKVNVYELPWEEQQIKAGMENLCINSHDNWEWNATLFQLQYHQTTWMGEVGIASSQDSTSIPPTQIQIHRVWTVDVGPSRSYRNIITQLTVSSSDLGIMISDCDCRLMSPRSILSAKLTMIITLLSQHILSGATSRFYKHGPICDWMTTLWYFIIFIQYLWLACRWQIEDWHVSSISYLK